MAASVSGFSEGLLSARPAAPVVGQDRPALVIAPATGNLQIPRREALTAKSRPAGQGNRGPIVGLDVGFHAVQPEVGEGITEDKLDRLAHVSLPGVRLTHGVAKVRALERAANDLGQIEEAID